MDLDGPKQNANPTVLAVEKNSSRLKRQAQSYPELAAWSTDNMLEENGWEILPSQNSPARTKHRTPTDRAILQALTEASIATKGKGVALLRNLGLNIPTTDTLMQPIFTDTFVDPPRFVPLTTRHRSKIRNTNTSDESKSKRTEKRRDMVDADEVFEIIRNIQDPEHPLTLEQLGVVSKRQIDVHDIMDDRLDQRIASYSTLDVRFTPTIPHCSMATHIGLCLRVKLDRSLPPRFKVKVRIEPGSHSSETAINKQLADKERVCAALENKHLLGIVNRCIIDGMTGNMT
jgi:metal-sulfur cluster biosynthetic enzyme